MTIYHSFRSGISWLISGVLTAFVPLLIAPAFAASLTNTSVLLSDVHPDATSVDYTVFFTIATTDDIKQMTFRFSTESAGTTTPAHLALGGATLGSTTNIGADWSVDTADATSGRLYLTRDTATSLSAFTNAAVQFHGITNPHLRDCISGANALDDTCYVSITTYSDDGSTTVDAANTFFRVVEDASLSFSVSSVGSGETHNGVTTSVTSTTTTLPFGIISPGSVKYAAHELHIASNAPGGYKVYAKLLDDITGQDERNYISPFGAVDATWSTPQDWATPTGTSRSSNSGWFGANTSDSRISGWSGASGKFGPISTTPHIVALSTTPDTVGSTIYVTYGLGVNYVQASDVYTGKIVYDVQAIY